MSEWARISYASEAEDLIIQRLLTAVIGLPVDYVGRYIDIGAYHPIATSNTFLFYQLGWSGICVEPNPEQHALYAKLRPRDLALNVGIVAQSGTLEYQRFGDAFLNGFHSKEHVGLMQEAGHAYLGSSRIPCLGAEAFIEQYVSFPVDVLNIDIEFTEASVLSAWNWSRCRPKLICVEIHSTSIDDMLRTPVAKILSAAGYVAQSRGVQSSMFVAKEHQR